MTKKYGILFIYWVFLVNLTSAYGNGAVIHPGPPIHIGPPIHPIPTFRPGPPIFIFLCGKFAGEWIINANGWIFDLNIHSNIGGDLTGTMSGLDPVGGANTIKGTCNGNRIEFTRVEANQTYEGNLMERGEKDIAGSFKAGTGQYGWFAIKK